MEREPNGEVGFALDHLPSPTVLKVQAFTEQVGKANTALIQRHLADHTGTRSGNIVAHTVAQARKAFKADYAAKGIRLVVASRGDAEPMAILTLKQLAEMLDEAKSRGSMVDALAPTKDLPAVRPFKLKAGPGGRPLNLGE